MLSSKLRSRSRFTSHANKAAPSSKKPTRGGVHWFKGRPGVGWEIVRVYFIGTSLHVADTFEGTTELIPLKTWPAGEWRAVRQPVD